MSMDLQSECGQELGLGVGAWAQCLDLAEKHGWIPCGTLPPDELKDYPWNGSYYGNNGQWVTAADARQMADALERAIKFLPDPIAELPNEGILDYLARSSAESEIMSKDFARSAVKFLSKGAFRVW
jgi:hypothetical protein